MAVVSVISEVLGIFAEGLLMLWLLVMVPERGAVTGAGPVQRKLERLTCPVCFRKLRRSEDVPFLPDSLRGPAESTTNTAAAQNVITKVPNGIGCLSTRLWPSVSPA